MKKTLCLVLALMLLIGCIPTLAAADSTPLIYRVTDSEGHQLFLIGTVHIGTGDMFPIAGIGELLGQCDVLALEVTQEQAAAASQPTQEEMAAEGGNNGLPQESLDKLAALLEAVGMGMYAPGMVKVKCQYILTLFVQPIIMQMSGVPMGIGVETYLLSEAKALSIPVIGLEDADVHDEGYADVTGGYSEDEYREALIQVLDDPTLLTRAPLEMAAAWASGDRDALIAANGDSQSDVNTGRNLNFYEKAKELLAGGSRALVAVGAAHVVMPGALADMFTADGYTVEVWTPGK